MTRQPGCLPTLTPDQSAVGLVQMSDAYGDISWQHPAGATTAGQYDVTTYGADLTGAADSAPGIQAAINAAISAGGGIVTIPAGTYKVLTTLTCHATVPVYIAGAGRWASILKFYGTGDCLRVYDDSAYGTRAAAGGAVTGLTIDGQNHTGTGAAGLHMGDIFQYNVDISVQNFSASGDMGVHFDNQSWWTEQLHGRIYAQNCAAGVVFDVSGAATSTGSYARIDMEICIDQRGADHDGVVLQNGTFLYDGRLAVRGNFGSSASPLTSAVLRLTGQLPAGHPGAGGYSLMFSMHLDVQVECGNTFTYRPQTIIENVPGGNFIRGCTGVLDFAGAGSNFTQSNLLSAGVLTPGAIWFIGPVYGDGSLNPATSGSSTSTPIITIGPTLRGRGAASYTSNNLNIYTHDGDYFLPPALDRTTAIVLNPSGSTLGAAQRVMIVLTQAASGGPYTVTWPVSGSPAITSPTVVWAGGVTPAMSATAGAVDIYMLETVNGRTWFGYAVQAEPPPLALATGGAGTTAQSLTANGQTITTSAQAYCPVTSGGAFTGLILQPGTYDGQVAAVVNKGSSTLTFAVSGTSNVATGTSAAIAATSGSFFTWDQLSSLWYPVA